MKALVIGATGATGKQLVDQLLLEDRFEQIVVFVRKEVQYNSSKIQVQVVDFDSPESWSDLVNGDVAFSCMGTTIKDAKTKENQRKVDYEYQYNFAKICSEHKVDKFVLVSSQGASAKSSMFYSRIKGELEDAVSKLDFKQLVILQPGLLKRPDSDRLGERLAEKLISAFNAIGIFKAYKPLPVQDLASTMILQAFKDSKGVVRIQDFNL